MLSHKTAQYILESCSTIQEISEPFFKATGINFFVFNRTQSNKVPAHGFFLTNHQEWCESFLKEDYQYRLSFTGIEEQFSGYKLLFGNLFPNNIMIKHLREKFSIDHFVLICKQFPDYVEWYTFGADISNMQITNFYVNNFADIINFVNSFKDKAKKIIKKVSLMPTSAFPLPRDDQKIFLNTAAQKILWKDPVLIELGENYQPKRYEFFINKVSVVLTRQEYKCVEGLLSGLTAKQIAKQLELSPRTVETYLDNIRTKAQVADRQQLIEFFRHEIT
jgi:DNA-binding CsgD family transcriptional regulator